MWTELIGSEMERTYKITADLMEFLEDGELNWKPQAGSNWMTTGQLLHHLSTCCAEPFRGFATGRWNAPSGGASLPPADALPSVRSKAEAKRALVEDRRAVEAVLASLEEHDLDTRMVGAPWDPRPMKLGYRLMEMVTHLNQHKGQLFYYLKMQGKPVNTMHLWGV